MGPKSFFNFVLKIIFINIIKQFKEILSWDECTPLPLPNYCQQYYYFVENYGVLKINHY
jgi:hypothetical protein